MKAGISALTVVLATAIPACCSVSDLVHSVMLGGQSNIVVWNPATKTEHFVRNAHFDTKAKDFGFIAPTPSKPALSKASGEAFALLANLEPVPEFKSSGGTDAADASKGVEVIEVKDVAGYRATVLKASDSTALKSWMKSNGYHTTESIREWTDFYIKKGWYLTAFKVQNAKEAAQTGVVRMSFKTDRPFNPYYVPKDNIPKVKYSSGPLTVFFVAPGVYRPKLENGREWGPRSQWDVPLEESDSRLLEQQLELKPGEIPEKCFVSAYVDHEFPSKSGSDLYFDFHQKLPDAKPDKPVNVVPYVLGGLGLAAVGYFIFKRR